MSFKLGDVEGDSSHHPVAVNAAEAKEIELVREALCTSFSIVTNELDFCLFFGF